MTQPEMDRAKGANHRPARPTEADSAPQNGIGLLLRRVANGDEGAAHQLWSEYAPAVRRLARRWLRDGRLRRVLDSTDVEQSAMACFFDLARKGAVAVTSPSELVHLLGTIARHRFLNRAEHFRAERRDIGRLSSIPVEDVEVADHQIGPMALAIEHETQVKFLSTLSPSELRLIRERAVGRSWTNLADHWGCTPGELGMRYSRLVRRLARMCSGGK